MIDDTQKPGPNPTIQNPIDPSNDMADTTDTHGLSGMTQNFTPNQSSTAQQQKDAASPSLTTFSSEMENRANDIASESEINADDASSPSISPTTDISSPFANGSGGTVQASSSASFAPSVSGEQSVSGDMPDPESDDDTLANAQVMGFQVDEDSENPKELTMAADFDRGEEEAHK